MKKTNKKVRVSIIPILAIAALLGVQIGGGKDAYCVSEPAQAIDSSVINTPPKGIDIKIDKTIHMDKDLLLEKGTVNGVTINIATFKNGSGYHLEKLVVDGVDKGKAPVMTDEAVMAEARKVGASVAFTGGFWNIENIDDPWSQKELNAGKTGYVYSNNKGELRYGDKVSDGKEGILKALAYMGESGWDTGAFGSIVKNGEAQGDFGVVNKWHGDDNVGNARTIIVELNDGKTKIIQTTGHFSQKTGLSHSDVLNLLSVYGIKNIKNAFLLDGGGTARFYTKDSDGKETVDGAKVDNRTFSNLLYLTKKQKTGPNNQYLYRADPKKVNSGTSETITYSMYKSALDKNLDRVPGTVYTLTPHEKNNTGNNNSTAENTKMKDDDTKQAQEYPADKSDGQASSKHEKDILKSPNTGENTALVPISVLALFGFIVSSLFLLVRNKKLNIKL